MAKEITDLKKRLARKGMLLTAPYMIFAAIFFLYPLVWLVVLTFSHWNFIGLPKFVGFENIARIFSSSLFWISVWNTFKFMLCYIPMVFISAFLLALILRKLVFGKIFIVISFMLAQVS